MLALILLRDYDKLADRFVGAMPKNAEADLFGCGTHDKSAIARPTCPIRHDEAVELIKRRLRACWWGPRAKKAASADAGVSFARAKEWEASGTLPATEALDAPSEPALRLRPSRHAD